VIKVGSEKLSIAAMAAMRGQATSSLLLIVWGSFPFGIACFSFLLSFILLYAAGVQNFLLLGVYSKCEV